MNPNIIHDHRGGPDRVTFRGFPEGAAALLPPPDCRWNVAAHVQGRAFSDKWRFDGKSEHDRYVFERYNGPITVGKILVTHVFPMLSPQFGTILRVRCGCAGMEFDVNAYPIICNPDYPASSQQPFIIDEANKTPLIAGFDMDVMGETYSAWQPTNAGEMALQNYAIGIEFTALPDGGIWGDCCNKGCCPVIEMVTLGMDVCFTDSFSGDCAGRCAATWTPPEKCKVVEPCAEDAAIVTLTQGDGPAPQAREAGDDDGKAAVIGGADEDKAKVAAEGAADTEKTATE